MFSIVTGTFLLKVAVVSLIIFHLIVHVSLLHKITNYDGSVEFDGNEFSPYILIHPRTYKNVLSGNKTFLVLEIRKKNTNDIIFRNGGN